MNANTSIPVFKGDNLTLVRVSQRFNLALGEDEFTVRVEGSLDDGTSIADSYLFRKTPRQKWEYKQYDYEVKFHLEAFSSIPPETISQLRLQLFQRLLHFLQLQPSALERPFDNPKSPT